MAAMTEISKTNIAANVKILSMNITGCLITGFYQSANDAFALVSYKDSNGVAQQVNVPIWDLELE